MHSVAKRSAAVASALGLAGISSLFIGAAPASAAPSCGTGTLVAGNVCEQTFTGDSTFTPTPQMTQLQVLLVGGGGSGGYSGGGGGGQVEVVDFDGATATQLTIGVSGAGGSSSVTEGTTTVTAAPGTSAIAGPTFPSPGTSGVSGSGKAGWPEAGVGGGGGGASASPVNNLDGGAGVVASAAPVVTATLTPATPVIPLFSDDTACYGGGGAVGDGTTDGAAGCNAGSVQTGSAITDPQPNFGGGGGALITTPTSTAFNSGAGGVVVVRWNATPTVTLTFNSGGHGTAPATESLLSGSTPTKPVDPAASGFVFKGWYTDPGFTTAADFSAPITASTTFYADFVSTLATTGGTLNPFEIPLGVAGLGIGLALVVVARRRSHSRI
jgi:uncharacterized repeat protein (TIGR02543 family)